MVFERFLVFDIVIRVPKQTISLIVAAIIPGFINLPKEERKILRIFRFGEAFESSQVELE